MVPLPVRDAMWFPGLLYASIERCWGDWRAANSKVTWQNAPNETEMSSADVPKIDNTSLLFEKDARWNSDVNSVGLQLVREWDS